MLPIATTLLMTMTPLLAAPTSPKTDGLVLWLDASDTASLKLDAKGRVVRWLDRSPARHHAKLAADGGPRPAAFNGKSALRFTGSQAFCVPLLAEGPGDLTVFVVYRRLPEQASDSMWQRVLSCWDGKGDGDNKGSGFVLCTKEGSALEPALACELLSRRHRGELWIGANMKDKNQYFRGDLAEILIYDHGFLVDEQIQDVKRYLREKWGLPDDAEEDWTRQGLLTDLPERKTDRLPLSDQEDAGKWQPYEPLWDEFNGTQLDAAKWWDHNPNWYGRAPSRYVAENVAVRDGMLHLTMSRDDTLPREKLYANGADYHTYAAASVVSKGLVLYGYFEIRMRPMNSAASSAFWFSSNVTHLPTGKPYRSEIDVFELGGKAAGHEKRFNMNAHIFYTPQEGEDHWNKGGRWEAPFRLADDYHTVGLHWAPDFLTYYFDGVPLRKMKNTHWHAPLYLIFDSETMGSWLGMPKDEDLPSTFTIDYVRTWKNAATAGDWTKTFKPTREPGEPTKITEYVRSLSARRRQGQ